MPDLFPPVERRSIVGTGMNADPENIEDLEQAWSRRERADRKRPKKGFGQVLEESQNPEPEEKPTRRSKR